jgi:hypothetical protein
MENQDWQRIVELLVGAKRCLSEAWQVLDGTDGRGPRCRTRSRRRSVEHRRHLRDRACERVQRGRGIPGGGAGVLGEGRRASRLCGRYIELTIPDWWRRRLRRLSRSAPGLAPYRRRCGEGRCGGIGPPDGEHGWEQGGNKIASSRGRSCPVVSLQKCYICRHFAVGTGVLAQVGRPPTEPKVRGSNPLGRAFGFGLGRDIRAVAEIVGVATAGATGQR